MRSNLQIYTVHEFDFRCRQTEEHASVQIIHSFYKLCSPYFATFGMICVGDEKRIA
jgi:hypothetical protein